MQRSINTEGLLNLLNKSHSVDARFTWFSLSFAALIRMFLTGKSPLRGVSSETDIFLFVFDGMKNVSEVGNKNRGDDHRKQHTVSNGWFRAAVY